jgi:dTDP-glucose 4,6-dehydratase
MDDVSKATWTIASEAPVGETYHISTDRIISIRDLVETLCGMLGKDFTNSVEVVGDRLGKDSAYWLNSGKLRKTLDWRDQIGLEQGLEQTIAWVSQNLTELSKQPASYFHRP